MRKRDEMSDPKSCLNTAQDDEMVFVLKTKDEAAPATIRFWMAERVRLGLNTVDDPKLAEAEACAMTMQAERPVRYPPKES